MKRKWYVIKDNNTNEYYDGGSDDDCWTSTINLAYIFYDKSDAEHEKDVGWNKYKFNDDCEIIELCEDDEEYQELKEYNEKLKQQLAEKDHRIAVLELALWLACEDLQFLDYGEESTEEGEKMKFEYFIEQAEKELEEESK